MRERADAASPSEATSGAASRAASDRPDAPAVRRVIGALLRFSVVSFVVAIVVGAAVGAYAYRRVQSEPARFQSQVVMVIDNPLELATSGDSRVIDKLNRLRTKYAALSSTSVIVDPVAEDLGLPAGVVRASTSVVPNAQSLILVVVATSPFPQGAADLAQAMAERLSAFVEEEHEAANVPQINRFTLEATDDAFLGIKISPTRDRAVANAAIGSVSAALLVYVGLQVLRGLRRS